MIYDENIIASINSLKIKNLEYVGRLRDILNNTQDDSLDYEKYMVNMMYNDRIVPTNIVGFDVLKISNKNAKDLHLRILENNVSIALLVNKLPPYSMTLAQIAQWKTDNGIGGDLNV